MRKKSDCFPRIESGVARAFLFVIARLHVVGEAVAICVLFILPLCAGGNTGASFLKIGVGARALGMGSAFTAVADDASAVYWNPGGLSFLNQKELFADHTEFVADVKLDSLGYAHRSRWGAIGLSATHLTQGVLEGRSEDRRKTGSFGSTDGAGTLTVSRKFTASLGAGLSIKLIQQRIATESADAVAGDAGLLIHTPVTGLRAGLAIQNLGLRVRFFEESYSLPLTITGGLSYRIFNGMTVGLDARRRPHEGKTHLSFGTEYSPLSAVSLRAGYLFPLVSVAGSSASQGESVRNSLGVQDGLSAGLGLRLSRYRLDYAFTPAGELGNVQRLGFSLSF